MTANAVEEFARYLASKSYKIGDVIFQDAGFQRGSMDRNLRRLWESSDISASDFADEVARFYGLARVGLQQLIAAAALTAGFSPRFLRETTIFPHRGADGRTRLAIADPGDVAAVRAAEI